MGWKRCTFFYLSSSEAQPVYSKGVLPTIVFALQSIPSKGHSEGGRFLQEHRSSSLTYSVPLVSLHMLRLQIPRAMWMHNLYSLVNSRPVATDWVYSCVANSSSKVGI